MYVRNLMCVNVDRLWVFEPPRQTHKTLGYSGALSPGIEGKRSLILGLQKHLNILIKNSSRYVQRNLILKEDK